MQLIFVPLCNYISVIASEAKSNPVRWSEFLDWALQRGHTRCVSAVRARLIINFAKPMLYLDRTRCNPEKCK